MSQLMVFTDKELHFCFIYNKCIQNKFYTRFNKCKYFRWKVITKEREEDETNNKNNN